MNIENQKTKELIGKDKKKSIAAANYIVNEKDMDAWQSLINNEDFLFDFIKDKAGNFISRAFNRNNIWNIFEFMNVYSKVFSVYIVDALINNFDENIEQKLLTLLEEGSNQEKAYAIEYFGEIQDNSAENILIDYINDENEIVKTNSIVALGKIKSNKAYEFFIEKLKSDDDWQKVDAAQNLSLLKNKDAVEPMLKSIRTTGMAETISGEIASLINLSEVFVLKDEELKELSLETFDNILSGLVEEWSLTVLFEFEVYNCVSKLIELSKNKEDFYCGKYAQLLIKAKGKINLFLENNQYTFDESKESIKELNQINDLLNKQENIFWNDLDADLSKEILNSNKYRKISAIKTVSEFELNNDVDILINLLINESNENVIVEVLLALQNLNKLELVKNKNEVLEKISNENLRALAKSLL